MRWIVHYGSFSSYDAAGEESFIEVEAVRRANQWLVSTQQRLKPDEVARLMNGGTLEPVYAALRELERTKHNE